MNTERTDSMEKLVSLAKRRGFIYQGSEIYGGLAGTWDYGPLGVALKNNIKQSWWKRFVSRRPDMFGLDAALLMNQRVWETSGHVGGFSDPLVECTKCKRRFRADQLSDATRCPECGGALGEERQFNMMFKTNVGATQDESSVSYLRPETAQGIFVNFKNVLDSFHPKMPFGICQIGKAFRNEIAPRDFIFRTREFEQMEIEYFTHEREWQTHFEALREEMKAWITSLGIPASRVHEIEVADGDRAHYSKRTIDFEFEFPFGTKELCGLAYRTDFDLSRHAEASGADLSYFDDERKERFIPHVIEPSFGLDRIVLALLANAYTEDTLGDEPRTLLKLAFSVAPVKIAVFPLLKNKPDLVEKAREVYARLAEEFDGVVFDDNGNIGKRYRRQDEIGTPYCVTIDFDTIGKGDEACTDMVTVRNRDTGTQERVAIAELSAYIRSHAQRQ